MKSETDTTVTGEFALILVKCMNCLEQMPEKLKEYNCNLCFKCWSEKYKGVNTNDKYCEFVMFLMVLWHIIGRPDFMLIKMNILRQ